MKFVAKTLYGLEQVLAEELKNLGAADIQPVNRAVLFSGNKELLYRVNYCSRTALSVLMNIADFRIRSKDDLYNGSFRIEWDHFMGPDDTFSVTPVVNSTYFPHTGYAGLILKDAVADYFRKQTGRRPSVNPGNPDILINLHVSNDQVSVSLDSSVVPLFKRGYRQDQTTAPLNEVLAAGILMISGWSGSTTLLDPMCGSGTFPVEAGLIACNIPPGKFRKYFGFERWKDFDPSLLAIIKNQAEIKIVRPSMKIYGSDILPEAARLAVANVERAGLGDFVDIKVADFRELKAMDSNGIVFLNPPYGQRLQPEEIDSLYGMIGTTLKHGFNGNTAWLITSNKESLKFVGLKPKLKKILFNGALECTLLKYEMYQGSKRSSQ